MTAITQIIAQELNVQLSQVDAAMALLDEGATVPFISRYRKEVTGGLDDSQLRQLNERLIYLRELGERRTSVLASIEEQGKLTPELRSAIEQADTKTRLEDLYLPYKKKRRTKAAIAIEAGLEPLADAIMQDFNLDPEKLAVAYINDQVADVKAALDGARFILMERFAEDADLLARLRSLIADKGMLMSSVSKDMESKGEKYLDYFDYREPISKVPPHRALALFRGRKEAVLSLKLDIPDLEHNDIHPCEQAIAQTFGIPYSPGSDWVGKPAASQWLTEVVRWTWRVKLLMQIENDLLGDLREAAEAEAIKVFADNLKDLLLASPAGQRATIGLDPGLRTGVKVAVVDGTGQYLDNTAIFPHAPKNQWDESIATLAKLAKKYDVSLIAIGNGTASRETEKLAAELIRKHPDLKMTRVVVSEAGASVYSASEFASNEFPDLDVTVRGAISIARRLQDPLAELVKIDPQSIGVGQYQHDVSQFKLSRSLDAVVEDCVNAVGVEVNTASVALLNRVSGLSETQASNIVEWRNANGRISSREQLKKIPRMGAKTFEQAAGFLRIQNGDVALDASAVHPESYALVQDIATKNQCEVVDLLGNKTLLAKINARDFVSDKVGLPTVQDIITELDKPGRDPRPEFEVVRFKEGVEKLTDLVPDMLLEGNVTNITNFGAFVDIGVHQDGLVHISAMADKFVKDPREVVKTGDIVKVKVMSVDVQRKRIALSMRLGDSARDQQADDGQTKRSNKPVRAPVKQSTRTENQPESAFAAAFAKARSK
ncbi:MAG: RNA-binding transcriptional accessory protein [Gammaproteobacteria bacterium]|nr:RNA-binding transcriptional accessory protein [Gammaproteobacteria bacterium]